MTAISSIEQYINDQRAFSKKTFGPGAREAGVVAHIKKELDEVVAAENKKEKLSEWVDVIILGIDGAWRCGATPKQIVRALLAKLAKNKARTWPDWRKASPDAPIEHDRTRSS